MRGTGEASASLFSYVDREARTPARHPLRKIRHVVNDALASLFQILVLVRSERQLMEQMECNLLFRWFVGLGIDDAVWVPTVFSKNRDRLLTTEMSRKPMAMPSDAPPST